MEIKVLAIHRKEWEPHKDYKGGIEEDKGAVYVQQKLPLGYRLELDPGVTLLVGENGTGKSAFLRLMYTSILHSTYYRLNGHTPEQNFFDTRLIDSFRGGVRSYELDELDGFKKGREYYEFNPQRSQYFDSPRKMGRLSFEKFDKAMKKLEKINPSIKWKHIGKRVLVKVEDDRCINDGIYFLKEDVDTLVREVHKTRVPASDKNIFRHLKIVDPNPLYPLRPVFTNVIPCDTDDGKNPESLEPAFFSPYKGNHGAISPGSNAKEKFESDFKKIDAFYHRFSPTIKSTERYSRNNPLQSEQDETVYFDLDRITDFVLGRDQVNRRVWSPRDRLKTVNFLLNSGQIKLDACSIGEQIGFLIEDDAEAVVLLDEPTNFLSYRNKKRVLERIREFEQTHPNSYMLIATNDSTLIDNPGDKWKLLDFDQTPVKVKSFLEWS